MCVCVCVCVCVWCVTRKQTEWDKREKGLQGGDRTDQKLSVRVFHEGGRNGTNVKKVEGRQGGAHEDVCVCVCVCGMYMLH